MEVEQEHKEPLPEETPTTGRTGKPLLTKISCRRPNNPKSKTIITKTPSLPTRRSMRSPKSWKRLIFNRAANRTSVEAKLRPNKNR